MMSLPSMSTFALAAMYSGCGLLLGQVPSVDGHAYLMLPISRILFYTPAFQDSSFPDVEFCPHCYQAGGPARVRARAEALTDPTELSLYGGGKWPHLSAYERGELASNGNYYETDAISVRHGLCGDPGQTAPEGSNTYGQDNSLYPVLDTYAEGSVIEMKVVFSTYHWGHLEFFICNADDLPDGPDGPVTQGCFNMHPLDRAADDGDASPIDPNHKGRYYVDPPCTASERDQTMVPGAYAGDVVTARYQLPEGLTCERCIVQMVYYTGNSCSHPGYAEFNPPSWPSECAPNKADWITLDPGMCGDGDRYPEEFWNCADIAIAPEAAPGDPSPPSSSPRSSPSSSEAAPTEDPTPSPTDEAVTEVQPTPAPMPIPTPAPILTRTPSPEKDASEPSTSAGSSWMTLYPVPPTSDTADPERCADDYHQCGGLFWEGSTCCPAGSVCVERSDYFSQCIPE